MFGSSSSSGKRFQSNRNMQIIFLTQEEVLDTKCPLLSCECVQWKSRSFQVLAKLLMMHSLKIPLKVSYKT